MSQVLQPTLRIGYAVWPEARIEPFAALRQTVEDHGPLIDPAAFAELIGRGGFFSQIRRCRKASAARLETLLNTARQLQLPLTFRHSDGGMD